jgi:ubiquinone/menaquinone biosynthesis C-methylase UbiE
LKDKFSIEAKLYDKIWGRHDYDSDVKFLHNLFRRYGCKKIVDVGCGTGGHALRLAKLGYEVTGVDISPTMLEIARQKDKDEKVKFIRGDMRKLDKMLEKEGKFDAAICLGQTFSCLVTNKDVSMFLKGIHCILKKNGLLILDARNAKKIREEYLNQLILDHIIIEKKMQVLLLTFNNRWRKNPNVIIWRPIYLIRENGKIDFQIKEHKLRRFQFSELEKMLTENSFAIIATYSGSKMEEFREDEHESMWLITTAK